MNYFKKFSKEIYIEISWLYYVMGKGKEKRRKKRIRKQNHVKYYAYLKFDLSLSDPRTSLLFSETSENFGSNLGLLVISSLEMFNCLLNLSVR